MSAALIDTRYATEAEERQSKGSAQVERNSSDGLGPGKPAMANGL